MHTIIEKGWIHFGREWDSVDENGNENGNFHDISIGVSSETEGDLYIRGDQCGHHQYRRRSDGFLCQPGRAVQCTGRHRQPEGHRHGHRRADVLLARGLRRLISKAHTLGFTQGMAFNGC